MLSSRPIGWAAIRAWATRIWFALILVFVGIAVYSQSVSWREFYERVDPLYSVLSFFLILFGKFLTISLVQQTLQAFGRRSSFRYAWWAYAVGDISKYLPGGVWGIAGRLAVYKNSGIPIGLGSKILLLEMGVLVFVSFLTGIAILGLDGRLTLIVAAVLALACLPFGLAKFLLVPPSRSLAIVGQQVCAWSAFGASFAVLAQHGSAHLAGIFDVSFAIGTLAVFAPSGIGIRELVIGLLVTGPVRPIVEVAVFHRIIWLVCDVLVFSLSGVQKNVR